MAAPPSCSRLNGKVFTGRFHHPPVQVLFDRICRQNGIEHILTAPRSPTTADGLCPTSVCSPIEIDSTAATERFGRLQDGRQIAEVRVPSRNVRVTIISPDAAFAAHLAEFEIYIVNK